MCKAMEDMRNESLKEGLEIGEKRSIRKTVLRMLEDGDFALEKIAKISGLSLDEIERLQAEQRM